MISSPDLGATHHDPSVSSANRRLSRGAPCSALITLFQAPSKGPSAKKTPPPPSHLWLHCKRRHNMTECARSPRSEEHKHPASPPTLMYAPPPNKTCCFWPTVKFFSVWFIQFQPQSAHHGGDTMNGLDKSRKLRLYCIYRSQHRVDLQAQTGAVFRPGVSAPFMLVAMTR